MTVWTYALASVIVVSLLSLIGVFTLALNRNFLQRILLFMVSFAVGGLFGDAFIHLIPEALNHFSTHLAGSMLVLGGVLFFFVPGEIHPLAPLSHGHVRGSTRTRWCS